MNQDHLKAPSLAPGLKATHFQTGQATEVTGDGPAGPDAATEEFLRAVTYGFYGPKPNAERMATKTQHFVADGLRATVVKPDPAPTGPEAEYGLGENFPVGTFATFFGSYNAGKDVKADASIDPFLPVVMCTDATVNPGYRRRGILRYMMTEAMLHGLENGCALAALTATEATIYQRFGYGVASRQHRIKVNTGPGFQINTEEYGRVVAADPAKIGDLADKIFATFHRNNPGSITRPADYRDRITGNYPKRDGTSKADALRAAIHISPDGEVDAYTVYEMVQKNSGFPDSILIHDLVYNDVQAYLELWKFLGSLDLITSATWGSAPVRDPLTMAMANPRDYQIKEQFDLTWVRVLDVPQAMAGRGYGADGACTLEISDNTKITEGAWELQVKDLQGTATKVESINPEQPVLRMEAHVLASLYSGDVDLRTLLAAGTVTAAGKVDKETLDRLNAMFRLHRRPYSVTYF
ncbi:GNAT family N-acetyltransferase [Micrococcoides hystricis]|uniref:GNAT family N-acetyltransferase n=1 Tax=Micrococcoides hystricis TaxID=1572761 RepID=A0ABV6P725_9MICC